MNLWTGKLAHSEVLTHNCSHPKVVLKRHMMSGEHRVSCQCCGAHVQRETKDEAIWAWKQGIYSNREQDKKETT